MNLHKIVQIGNRAKQVSGGDYSLANTALAVVLQEYLDNKPEGLEVEIETQDPDGGSSSESYFDLVVVRAGESSLCIPLPLLEAVTIAVLVKRGNFVERRVHNRTYQDSPEVMSTLWEELWEEVDCEVASRAVNNLLAEKQEMVADAAYFHAEWDTKEGADVSDLVLFAHSGRNGEKNRSFRFRVPQEKAARAAATKIILAAEHGGRYATVTCGSPDDPESYHWIDSDGTEHWPHQA